MKINALNSYATQTSFNRNNQISKNVATPTFEGTSQIAKVSGKKLALALAAGLAIATPALQSCASTKQEQTRVVFTEPEKSPIEIELENAEKEATEKAKTMAYEKASSTAKAKVEERAKIVAEERAKKYAEERAEQNAYELAYNRASEIAKKLASFKATELYEQTGKPATVTETATATATAEGWCGYYSRENAVEFAEATVETAKIADYPTKEITQKAVASEEATSYAEYTATSTQTATAEETVTVGEPEAKGRKAKAKRK